MTSNLRGLGVVLALAGLALLALLLSDRIVAELSTAQAMLSLWLAWKIFIAVLVAIALFYLWYLRRQPAFSVTYVAPEWRLSLWFSVLAGLILLTAWQVHQDSERSQQAEARVSQSYEVLYHSEAVWAQVQQLASAAPQPGSRTGMAAAVSSADVETSLRELRQLTRPFPTLYARLEALNKQVSALFDTPQNGVGETLSAADPVQTMAALREQLQLFQGEQRLQLQRDLSERNSARNAVSATVQLGSVLLVGILLFAGYLMRINLLRQRQHQRELEKSVDLRTVQLRNEVQRHQAAREQMQASEVKFRTLTETTAAAIFIYQGDHIVYANPEAERISGYSAAELCKMQSWGLVHPDFREQSRALAAARMAGQDVPKRYEFQILTRSGEARWLDFTAGVITYEGQQAGLGTAYDITERKQHEATLAHLATHDSLTGLPNQTLALERLRSAISDAKRHHKMVAVVQLNLKRFRAINDSLGHDAGNQILQLLAQRLGGLVREADTLARPDSDNYLVLLPDLLYPGEAASRVQQLLTAFEQPLQVNASEVFIAAAAGVSFYPTDSEDADTLLRHAATALNRDQNGDSSVLSYYSAGMFEQASRRLALEASLHRALERNELLLHYQPKQSVASGKIVSSEALLRWQHPEYGMVSPIDFVAMAEEVGLIAPIGAWAIHSACVQAQHWLQNGLPICVAVNVSGVQFASQDIVAQVKQALDATGLPAHLLELEITESALIGDLGESITKLNALKALGISLALDDFGTGYSSLSYLRHLPVDSLKIDRSFVVDMVENAHSLAIVTAIIGLAHGLNLHVVAEGVETEAQYQLLQRLGCDTIQGYYISRPIAAAAFSALVAGV
jgi:PAS domain S-box-containing protein/diguanylate cyclase (GGDEF)-like protein